MKAPPDIECSVRTTLNRFADAYAKRDVSQLRAAFIPDSDVMLYGTGADEKPIGLSQIQALAERDWSQSEAAAVTYGWMSVSSAGSVAWAATDAKFAVKAGDRDTVLPARITFVLEKRDEQWLIAQGHCSFPAAEQAEGQSFPA